MQELKEFGIIPVDFKTISSKLSHYKSPRDKVSNLKKSNQLIRLKKGLYIVSPDITNQSVSKELIANHLYGPSYISLETALSFYGIIPERVYSTLSVTFKRKKRYSTPLGIFEYRTVPVKYLSIGISQKIVQNSYAYLMASPEKAICDLIVTKSGIRFQSLKAITEYLMNDLRVDLDVIEKWDLTIIDECIKYGYKKEELRLLRNFIKNECSI
jgi:predicted transcriptional regulator of viral defense system